MYFQNFKIFADSTTQLLCEGVPSAHNHGSGTAHPPSYSQLQGFLSIQIYITKLRQISQQISKKLSRKIS